MKVTKRSTETLVALIVWGLVSLHSVELATGVLVALVALGLVAFVRDPKAFILKTPEGTTIDKVIGWAAFLYIAVSTYPFTELFVIYTVLEVVGSTLVYLTRKGLSK